MKVLRTWLTGRRKTEPARPKTSVEITGRAIIVRWEGGEREVLPLDSQPRYRIRSDSRGVWIQDLRSEVTRLLSWPVEPDTTLLSERDP